MVTDPGSAHPPTHTRDTGRVSAAPGRGVVQRAAGLPPVILADAIATAQAARYRPELPRMLDHRRQRDTVVVWNLGQRPRSLKDVLHVMQRIAEGWAGF